jgi:ABC-type phosphate/phosphonate transport system substrate-binding protein
MRAFDRIILYLWVAGALLSQSGYPVAAGNGEVTSRLPILNVGYPNYAFSEVDIKDAQAALEIWTRQMVKGSSPLKTKVTIYPDEASLLRALQTNEVNMAALASTSYLKIKDTLPVEPFFVPLSKGQVGEEFCLLAHRQRGITAASQLKNRKLLYFPRCSPNSPQNLWLDYFLKSEGLGNREQFFQSVEVTETPSQAILPVFFGKIDACYVPRQAFETMAEMNPQVGRDLQILVHSPLLLRGLLIIRSDVDGKLREAVKESLTVMEKQPQGKQILTLLRYDRLVPYQPGQLAAITDFLKRMNMLEAHHQGKKGL